MTLLGLPQGGFLLLSGVAVGALVNVLIFRETLDRDVPVARVYRWLVLAAGLYCVASIVVSLSPTPATAFAADVVLNAVNLAALVASVFFAIVYTGHRSWLTRRRAALIAAEPAAYVALLATNPVTGLVASDVRTVRVLGLTVVHIQPTPLSLVHLLFIMGLTVAEYVLFVRFFFRARNVYRMQTGLIALGGLIIPVAAFAFGFGATPIDMTPFALAINGAVVWIALFKYNFLDVVPLAADLLVDEMADPIVVADQHDRILDANRAAKRLFGDDDPLGKRLSAVSETFAEAIRTEDEYVRMDAAGGERRTYDPSVTVVHDQYGIRRGTLVVLHDVTEQVRRQVELERQNDRLNEFASVVSHDLRNPLNVTEGYVTLAYEEGDTSYLERAIAGIDRMNELVDDLLLLAREGQSVGEVESVPLASVVETAWKNVDAPDATLVNEATGEIDADEQRLQQLFENLFRNAVQHGGPGVTVRVGRSDGRFFVEDDGPGIPDADRERVFEHGYTTTEGGTGFGLAIVRSIAEAHGWTVEAGDATGGGARFEFVGVSATAPPPQS